MSREERGGLLARSKGPLVARVGLPLPVSHVDSSENSLLTGLKGWIVAIGWLLSGEISSPTSDVEDKSDDIARIRFSLCSDWFNR